MSRKRNYSEKPPFQNGWWFFHNVRISSFRVPPWLWKFNEERNMKDEE
tara:strand:- start:2674 stop:2817 length:144 start_codon:yes stop_codon:yes gene_type:complete